ncbi:hypothetical protein C8Q72DRAFT_372793 [Fomitopsis betulina]|nr:hypothetical protein C8Q72DRAFT_372793 [Fomitopsis betulina]
MIYRISVCYAKRHPRCAADVGRAASPGTSSAPFSILRLPPRTSIACIRISCTPLPMYLNCILKIFSWCVCLFLPLVARCSFPAHIGFACSKDVCDLRSTAFTNVTTSKIDVNRVPCWPANEPGSSRRLRADALFSSGAVQWVLIAHFHAEQDAVICSDTRGYIS